jgi:hypothetical protein
VSFEGVRMFGSKVDFTEATFSASLLQAGDLAVVKNIVDWGAFHAARKSAEVFDTEDSLREWESDTYNSTINALMNGRRAGS